MAVSTENELILMDFLKDDVYLSQFLTADDDKKAEAVQKSSKENLHSIISYSLTVAEQLSKLTKGISMLEKSLYNIVVNNHKEFMSQSLWLDEFESRISGLKKRLQDMMHLAGKLKDKINKPYDKMEMQCKIVNRLHETSNILRCMVVIQNLVRHLPEDNLIKASILIREIDETTDGIDLSGIEILEKDQRLINAERLKLKENARQVFLKGLEEFNDNQVDTALQVFSNLNILNNILKEFLHTAISNLRQDVKAALNVQSESEKSPKNKAMGPGKVTGGTFPGGNVTTFRSKLWASWNALLENTVYSKCAQMCMLEMLLNKTKSKCNDDFLFEVENRRVAYNFWKQISEVLSKNLIGASQSSTFVKQALEGEYPKLLRFHIELNKNLQKLFKNYHQSSPNHPYPFPYSNNFADQFETAYLSQSLSRLLSNVESLFSGDGHPPKEQIDSFVHVINSELNISTIDETLCRSVVRNIEKAIHLFYIKCEQMLVLEGNFTQVIDPPNSTQNTNVEIANSAHYLKEQINLSLAKTVTDLAPNLSLELNKTLHNMDSITNAVFEPICTSICEAVESIILTIHDENLEIDDTSTSLYMRELKTFIQKSVNIYLKPYSCQEIRQKRSREIATRCIDLFLRHVCLKRPLSSVGRRKLAFDFNQMESVILSLCDSPNELGKKYKLLKSFSTLICSNVEDLAENKLIGDVIPYSLALMYLFSYAPSELLSPHKSCNWSIVRLSQWLDNHTTEQEKLDLIKSAIQRYEEDVKKQKIAPHYVYSIMIRLLESASLAT